MSDAGASRVKSPAPSSKPLGSFSNASKLSMNPNDSDVEMLDTPYSGGTIAFGSKDDVKVEAFYGDRAKLVPFLTQLKVVFKLNPVKYKEAKTQVLYAAMQLKGAAQSWFQPMLSDYVESETPDKDTQACFRNFAKFEELIKQVFGTVNEARAASRTIYTLRQKGSAASYFSEFQKVAKDLSWEDEDAFAEIFYNGLKDSVRQKMMKPPTTYKDMVAEAIDIDNRLYELSIENRSARNPAGRGGSYLNQPRGYHFRGRNSHRQDYGDPMDLSNLNAGRASRAEGRGRGNRGRPWGNDREKDRRRKEGLCFACGKTGHRARECQNSTRGLHMMNMEGGDADGSVETKADTTEGPEEPTEGKGTTAQKDRQESDNPQGLGESEIEKAAEEYWEKTWLTRPKKTKKKTQTRRERFDELLGNEKTLEAQYNARRKAKQHVTTSWHFCYDDGCQIHLASKTENVWFPHEDGGSLTPRQWRERGQETLAVMTVGQSTKDKPTTWDEGQDWKEIRTNQWSWQGEEFRFDPNASQGTEIIFAVRKCQLHDCPDKENEHTHDVVGGKAYEITFRGSPKPHAYYNLSMMQKGPEDKIHYVNQDAASITTRCWIPDEQGKRVYNPHGKPQEWAIRMTLFRCDKTDCQETGHSHTHDTIHGKACHFPFPEPVTNERTMVEELEEKDRWWLNKYLEETPEGNDSGTEDYEVVVSKNHLMIFNTTHYQVSRDNGKEKLTFDPTGRRQEEARPVSIEGCYNRDCKAVEFYHSHDTVGGVVVKYDPLTQTIGGLPAKLVSLDDNEEEWKEVEPTGDESDNDSVRSTGEAKLYVVNTTRNWIKIVTNYWEYKECEGCAQEPKWHTHVVYNPDVKPQPLVNSISISFCTNFDCPQGRSIHAHPGVGSSEQIEMQVPPEEATRLWGTTKPTMRNLMPTIVKMDEDIPRVDSRAEPTHIYRHFSCAYETCGQHFKPHQHVWNVSPDEPERPIARGKYWTLKTCTDRACKHPYGRHVHSKNDDRMAN